MNNRNECASMLSQIAVTVEDYCPTCETTTLEAVNLILLRLNELEAKNKRLEQENFILKRDEKGLNS